MLCAPPPLTATRAVARAWPLRRRSPVAALRRCWPSSSASWMAIVPLLMAMVAIPTTFLLIWPLAAATDASVIVKFLVALIGLAIAIDYALLVVVRWREERLRPGTSNETAAIEAMQHAGRAVVFSGSTVGISLLALVVDRPRPAQPRHRRHADTAGQRRGGSDLAASRTGYDRPRLSPSSHGPRGPGQPRVVGLASRHRPPPRSRGRHVDGHLGRTPGCRVLDPARQPAR